MENANDNNIPSVIKRVRKGQKLSQRVFAEKLGVNIKTVQNWEYKGSSPTRTNIQTVIDTFRLKEEDDPELFEYIAHPRPYGEAESAKAEESAPTEAAAKEEVLKNAEDEKKPFFKRVLSAPINNAIIFSVTTLMAILITVGVFFILFFIFSDIGSGNYFIEYILPVICAVAAGIAIMLVAHFSPIKKAFIVSLTTTAAVGAFFAALAIQGFSHRSTTLIISACTALIATAAVILVYYFVIKKRKK